MLVSWLKLSNENRGLSLIQKLTIIHQYHGNIPNDVTVLCSQVPYHNDTIIKMQDNFFNKIYTSHVICKGTKGLLKGCVWEGAGDRTETVIFWPHCYDRQRCVFLVLLMLGSTLLGSGFIYCILSASSLDPNSSGPQAPSASCGFTYHIASISNYLLTSVLTALYNSSSPTRSLKSNV